MEIIIFTDINNTYGFGRECGAYRVATELRLQGYSVQVIDFFASLTLDDMQKIVDKFVTSETLFIGLSTNHFMVERNQQGYDLHDYNEYKNRISLYVGCNCYPQDNQWVKRFREILFNKNPNVKIVVGGEKAITSNRKVEDVDYWVLGQADKSIVALADAIKNNKQMPKIIHSNRDYEFKDFENSKIVWTNNDLLFKNEHVPIEIGRGCSFNCPFCSYKKKYSYQLVKNEQTLKDELTYNYENYGITSYMVMDPTVNDSIEKMKMLHRVFTSMPFQVEWAGFARLDMFQRYPEMRELYLESGCKSVQFGIESLNEKTVKVIKKGISPEKTKELLYFVNEKWHKKIVTGSFFIIGLPEETEEDLYRNAEWLLDDDCPLHAPTWVSLTIRKYNTEIEDEVSFSMFAKEMAKYGFVGNNQNWRNEKTGMTKKRTIEILYDLCLKSMNRKRVDFYYYSRMRNLGYSFDEIWDFVKDYGPKYRESNIRKEEMKNNYLERLWNL